MSNPNNNTKNPLQERLIKSLEGLIKNPQDFKIQFIFILKDLDAKNKSQITENQYSVLSDHFYETIKTCVTLLKEKNISKSVPEEIQKIILKLQESHAWISLFPTTHTQLTHLFNDCLDQPPSHRKRSDR